MNSLLRVLIVVALTSAMPLAQSQQSSPEPTRSEIQNTDKSGDAQSDRGNAKSKSAQGDEKKEARKSRREHRRMVHHRQRRRI